MCAHEARVADEPFWPLQCALVVAGRPSFHAVEEVEVFKSGYVVLCRCLGDFLCGCNLGYVPEFGGPRGKKSENGSKLVEFPYFRHVRNVVPEQMVEIVPVPCAALGWCDAHGFRISAAKIHLYSLLKTN